MNSSRILPRLIPTALSVLNMCSADDVHRARAQLFSGNQSENQVPQYQTCFLAAPNRVTVGHFSSIVPGGKTSLLYSNYFTVPIATTASCATATHNDKLMVNLQDSSSVACSPKNVHNFPENASLIDSNLSIDASAHSKNIGCRPKKRKGNTKNGGRPPKSFDEPISSALECTRAKKLFEDISKNNDPLVVQTASKLIVENCQESPINEQHSELNPTLGKHTNDSALAFYLEYNYNKRSYSALVQDINRRNCGERKSNLYPSYQKLAEAKKNCLPKGSIGLCVLPLRKKQLRPSMQSSIVWKIKKNRLKKYEFKLSNGKDVSVTFKVHTTNLSFLIKNGKKSLNLGLALLHAKIKACERLLHLAYKLSIGSKTLKWNVTKDVRDDVGAHKKVIQDNVRGDIGVRPDQVLQGHGTINTGNLARRCYQDPKKFAQTLGLDEDFVQNLANILILFESKRKINYDLLDQYCWEVYLQLYELYPWAHLNVSLHKLLMHGCRVARELPLPVSYFSEDSQEAWHKFYRKNLTQHARQSSKKFQLLDVYNRGIYESDPLISNMLIEERSKLLEKNHFLAYLERFELESENNNSDADCLNEVHSDDSSASGIFSGNERNSDADVESD
ncbi:hypothetical protein QAD02_018423 [Eretmocerus hayati]|uniref:Uncharacterized protein n=1 Tax=Eretmocerus hayati TaxID=131215 RepID=A0ACC2PII5_9HYME|nr:hypothetical protein QAD02_018423 [Eretmocerus hayati]